ncbi:hypothetical protein, partial [Janthinobacterium sp. DSP2-3-3]|uniref:hypothetical protein n=1 Tax=Janthinobacterium sp. DSP2-3-3 TaxID=2804596 RepID=UPI003CF486D3
TASGATRASAMFRPRCLLKNSANNHRRLETRVSAIDSTPQSESPARAIKYDCDMFIAIQN